MKLFARSKNSSPLFTGLVRAALLALILTGTIWSTSACSSFECSSTDIVCRPAVLLLFFEEPTCEFTGALNTARGAPLAQQGYIKAINAEDSDEFGGALDFDCTTQLLVVGATEEGSNAQGIGGNFADNTSGGSGAVYIYSYNGLRDEWIFDDYIKAPNSGAGDNFGSSVALSGDTLIVGSRNEDSNAAGVNGDRNNDLRNNSGAAYVYRRRPSGLWGLEAYLKASNPDISDSFGFVVDVDGDLAVVTSQAEQSLAVGVNADQFDNSGASVGAAYVFRRTGTMWIQEAYLKASNAEGSDRFGRFAAVSGETIAVGSIAESSNATGINGDESNNLAANSGAVYVFRNTNGVWSQEAYIKASNGEGSDNFGTVALSGDLLVVGAQSESSGGAGVNSGTQGDNSAGQSGAAYVFRRSGSVWSQEAYLKASNANGSDRFGAAVGISGSTIAVSATGEESFAIGVGGNQFDNSGSDVGAVYVFDFASGGWFQSSYVKASNSDNGDNFGTQLSISGDGLFVSTIFEQSTATGIDGDQSINTATNVGAVYAIR